MTAETKVRARRKAFRPDEILDAALEEFTRHGYAGTRLEDVAARAGVTKGTIYVYFPSKDQLFRAVVKKFQHPLLADAQQFIDIAKSSAIEFLRAFLRFIYEAMRTDRECREVFRLMIAEAERFPELAEDYHREVIVPLLETLREVIRQGVERGEIRHSAALEFPEIVVAPAALMHLWLLVFSNHVPVDADRYLEAHLDLMLHGLVQPGANALPAY
jgi:AcrR family transcriptional regulator